MDLISLLASLSDLPNAVNDFSNRNISAYLGMVSNNQDRENKRRVKVVNPANPKLETHWLRRINVTRNEDNPLPLVGQTVIVFSVDGVDTNGWYLPLNNNTNPPYSKASPQDDYHFRVDGHYTLTIGNDVTVTTDSGTSLIMDSSGNVNITAANSMNLEASDITLEASQINLNGNVSIYWCSRCSKQRHYGCRW